MIRSKSLNNIYAIILVPPQGDHHSYFVIWIRSIIIYLRDYQPLQKIFIGIINNDNKALIEKYKFIKDMGLDFINLSDLEKSKMLTFNIIYHVNDYQSWIYFSKFKHRDISFYTDGCSPYLDENHLYRLVKYFKFSGINNLNYYIFPAANLYYFWWLSCIVKKNYCLNYIDEHYLYSSTYLFFQEYKFSIKDESDLKNSYVITLLLRPNSNLIKIVNDLVEERINSLNIKNKNITLLIVPDSRIENINFKDLCCIKNVNILPLNNILNFEAGTPFEYIYSFFNKSNIKINEIICLDGKFAFNYVSMPKLFKSTRLIFGIPNIDNYIDDAKAKKSILKMINNLKFRIASIENLRFIKISNFLIMIENIL